MEKLSIEEKMTKLEDICKRLENEKMTLEESLSLYEEAMKLSSSLNEELNDVTKKIELIQNGISEKME
ncbi:MAG: exodeoxyribonuclease VII small subunit [Bacillales bacterium]|nr:exodeoxyribonuclease VII small subunit [Bacillales bacterium]